MANTDTDRNTRLSPRLCRFLVLGALTSSVLVTFLVESAQAGSVTLLHRNAVVWGRRQSIRGVLDPPHPGEGTVRVNGTATTFAITAPGDTFSVDLILEAGANAITVSVDSAGSAWISDTLIYTLGYRLLAECCAYATSSGNDVLLHGSVIENPTGAPLEFTWAPDASNPSPVVLTAGDDSVASFTFGPDAKEGEYYFNLLVATTSGDTTTARTIVTLDSGSARPFDIAADHARWIDSAIVYGVTPSIFVEHGRFSDVTNKIPELASLGVTTLWIQPPYTTYGGGQGYDVTDYFSIRDDTGGEGLLRMLVTTAHTYGMRVLLDFIPNHTSIHHPYAQDAIQYGPLSHYYDFYQRTTDNAPYGNNYNTRVAGQMTFVYYFWNDLVNLNYENPEVQRMMTEAGKYWIEKLGIDGYRVDAAWGVNARNPSFFQQWRLALKRLKPEILLLAEDKASVSSSDPYHRPSPFDHEFDAAYDWTSEPSWVSHWVWQSYYSASSNPTIFNNTPESQRGQALRNSLSNNGSGYSSSAMILRFMENNDTFRFLATHDLPRTKMAAGLLFSLNGIPLIFNGQEIGAATHPYDAFQIFNRGATISSLDAYGLFPYYQHLCVIRRRFPALLGRGFQELAVTPSASAYAYRRWSDDQNVVVCINMASAGTAATVSIPVKQMSLDSAKTYFLTDLVDGTFISGTPSELATITVQLPPYTTRLFMLADSVVSITSVNPATASSIPGATVLAQNYPNPFNPVTTIRFDLSERGEVTLMVFDILGREVETLIKGERNAGRYTVQFHGSGLSSGVYFYRLQTHPAQGGNSSATSIVRKMLLLK
jgi:cyclomaltodextrinase